MDEKYLYALDLSLSNSGVAIFDKNANCVKLCTISTKQWITHGERLKGIADCLLELAKQYPVGVVVKESVFTKFNKASAALEKVCGVVEYLFYDKDIISYAPLSIKAKILSGKATKEEVAKKIQSVYRKVVFEDNNQSDAFAVGLTYFIDNRKIEWDREMICRGKRIKK